MEGKIDSQSLKGKVCIVTGGSRGIGLACAKKFYDHGSKVLIVSRGLEELESAKHKIIDSCEDKERILYYKADITREEQVKGLFQFCLDKLGPVDILVNNAGAIKLKKFINTTLEDWNEVLGTNLLGSFLCSREAFRQMSLHKRAGSIINVSSLGGIRGAEKFPGTSSYVVAKHGIVGLTEILSVEGREFGIRVNCIAPGAVDTEMLRLAAPHLKTSTRPEDLAETFLFLADPQRSGKLSGAIIEIHSNE